jgi:hypothetical protein
MRKVMGFSPADTAAMRGKIFLGMINPVRGALQREPFPCARLYCLSELQVGLLFYLMMIT